MSTPGSSTPELGSVSFQHVTAADGVTLGVRRIEGQGKPIVALHGFTGDGSTMIPVLDACRDGRPVMSIDLVGHGASDSPEDLGHYAMSSVVDQVLSIIGPHDPGHVHLLGYSMGGRVALSIAARAPWYFGSITTISSTPGVLDPVDRTKRYDADQELAAHAESIGLDAFIDEWLALPLFASYVDGLSSAEREATIAQRRSGSVTGLANSLRGTGTGSMPPVWQTLPSLRSPMLAIAGEHDEKYVGIANMVREAAPAAQVAIVADAGHVAHQENCSAVAARITEFLEVCERHADF